MTATHTAPLRKITPPLLSPRKVIPRSSLLEQLRHLKAFQKRILIIEAAAGSGKTIFAQQYLQECGFKYGWFQIGREDQDTSFFLNTLISLLSEYLSSFKSTTVLPTLQEGAISPDDFIKFGIILAEEIAQSDKDNFVVVVDDVHLLEEGTTTKDLLKTIINHSPEWIQWVLISRHSVNKLFSVEKFNIPLLKVDNRDLNFSIGETHAFYQLDSNAGLPADKIKNIHSKTEGWITGVVLSRYSLDKENDNNRATDITTNLSSPNELQENLAGYFLDDVLATLPKDYLPYVFQLVLIDEIPYQLAQEIIGEKSASHLIELLENHNHFMRNIDEDGNIYDFHHLFREALLPVAKEKITADEQINILRKAAFYHLGQGETVKALEYAASIEDIPLCEKILAEKGFDILQQNRISSLEKSLNRITDGSIETYPWLNYYQGICCLNNTPLSAFSYLDNAAREFQHREDILGMALSISQLIEYHVKIDCNFKNLKDYIIQLEDIYNHPHNTFPINFQLRIIYSLALGHCFLQTGMDKVREYSSLALELSEKCKFDNMTVQIYIVRSYQHAFVGNLTACIQEIETSLRFLNNPRISAIARLFIRTLHVNLLEMMGDFSNYAKQKISLEQAAEKNIVLQSIIQPFIYIWDMDAALARGNLDKAESILNSYYQDKFASTQPHMRSQFLHYQALILALKGDKETSLTAIHESLKLRRQVGGEAFIILNHQIIGSAYTHLGLYSEAEEHLNTAMKHSKELEEEFQKPAILCHRSWLRILRGDDHSLIKKDVLAFVQCMRGNDVSHFFSFIPEVVESVLNFALQHNIEQHSTQYLIKKCLHKGVAKKGEIIPLLHIQFFINPQGSQRSEYSLAGADLTNNEKRLLSLLLDKPGLQINHAELAEILWPEKEMNKQRSSLDVLLSQLRKKIQTAVSQTKPGEYLVLENEYIKLKNCRVDVVEFLQYAQSGIKEISKENKWMAYNNFSMAFEILGQEQKCTTILSEDVPLLKEEINKTYTKTVTTMTPLLLFFQKEEDALGLLHTTLHEFPHNTEIARLLYDICASNGNNAMAQEVLSSYSQAHQKISSSPTDLDEALDAFWN